MDIEIRRANAADAALLALLGRVTFAETFGYLFREKGRNIGQSLRELVGSMVDVSQLNPH